MIKHLISLCMKLWNIYVVVSTFQKPHSKPLIYLLLQQGDSTSLNLTSVASMTFVTTILLPEFFHVTLSSLPSKPFLSQSLAV